MGTAVPFFSVIVPVYNVERYVASCLESVLCQTFADFELIVVDDGSNDSSGEICSGFAELDARVRFVTRHNGGLAAARNTGLSHASGRFVLFLDSDDWFCENDLLARIYQAVREHHADLVLFGHVVYREESDTFYRPHEYEQATVDRLPQESDNETTLAAAIDLGMFQITAWNKAYSREHLTSGESLFDESLLISEDIEWTYRCIGRFERCYVLSGHPYVYRIRKESNSLSSARKTMSSWSGHLRAIELAHAQLGDNGSSGVLSERLRAYLSYHFCICLMDITKLPGRADRRRAYREIEAKRHLMNYPLNVKTRISIIAVKVLGLRLGAWALRLMHGAYHGQLEKNGN